MFKQIFTITAILTAFVPPIAFAADSGFQNTCSNIGFAYENNQAALKAVCLREDGTATPASLLLQGISNQNGELKQGSGASTFQQSCGNIQILVDGPDVTLSALCRTTSGSSNPTSLPLTGIRNQDGKLVQ